MDQQQTKQMLAGQYRAALSMLGTAVEKCPDGLWLSDEFHNRFWHVAYHTIFYAHLYLHSSLAAFTPWDSHRPDSQFLGPKPSAPDDMREIGPPYAKEFVLQCHAFCLSVLDETINADDLDSLSGFDWLPFSRLGVHIYNVRHIQHHAGQLIDRLRNQLELSTPWTIQA